MWKEDEDLRFEEGKDEEDGPLTPETTNSIADARPPFPVLTVDPELMVLFCLMEGRGGERPLPAEGDADTVLGRCMLEERQEDDD